MKYKSELDDGERGEVLVQWYLDSGTVVQRVPVWMYCTIIVIIDPVRRHDTFDNHSSFSFLFFWAMNMIYKY